MKRLQSDRGMARLVIIMAAVVMGLAMMVAVPVFCRTSEDRLEQIDEEYRLAAERMARQQYISDYRGFEKVYDGEGKRFVALSALDKVEDYAAAGEHRGQLVFVSVTGNGDVTAEWETRKALEEVRDAEETDR